MLLINTSLQRGDTAILREETASEVFQLRLIENRRSGFRVFTGG